MLIEAFKEEHLRTACELVFFFLLSRPKSLEALNVTNPDRSSAPCQWVQMLSPALWLYDSKKTSLVWRPEMSRHDSSSESFIIHFIIYGEGLCAGCCFPSVVRTAAGMLRWGEFIYQEMKRLTPLAYCTLYCNCKPFVELFVATRHFCASLKTKQFCSRWKIALSLL